MFQKFLRPLSLIIALLSISGLAAGQTPADEDLSQAYKLLSSRDYDRAIALFRQALNRNPLNAAAHKDLAYSLLRVGENAAARDEFQRAVQLNNSDDTPAIEYAFLCYETKHPIEARRTFDRLRKYARMSTARATAETAFQNIDKPLAAGILRWQQALTKFANQNDIASYSAHLELAQLAEQRDDLPLAAEQFEICRQLKPTLSELLLDLARVWQQLNRVDEAHAALLAASRSTESRTAELGLERLGSRYPYPYEFVKAIQLDPRNNALRCELAYLYLAMKKDSEAIEQFQQVLAVDPNDSQSSDQLAALRGFKKRPDTSAASSPTAPAVASQPKPDAKTMGAKSLAAGYVNDAIKYLRQAHEEDPDDARVMLQLGYAYNMAHHDPDAIQWFNRARHASDPEVVAQAAKAYHNLTTGNQPILTVWALPMYSSRWNDAFTYGQIKRALPTPFLGRANKYLTFYLSTRFVGDAKSGLPGPVSVAPQFLSETSFIVGAGIATHVWHHLTGWVEAGEAIKYLPSRSDVGAAIPDYRGGANFAKGFGKLLGAKRSGLFYETTADAIYVHRFDRDWLFYSQHRAGRTFALGENTSAQLLFNLNYTRDFKNQYWANTTEYGPGIKLHLPGTPRNVYLSTDFLRGVYKSNPYYLNLHGYSDIRVGFWYAFSK